MPGRLKGLTRATYCAGETVGLINKWKCPPQTQGLQSRFLPGGSCKISAGNVIVAPPKVDANMLRTDR